MTTDYGSEPRELPLDDGEDSFDYEPVIVGKYLDFAERFRRQGKAPKWPFVGARWWGRDWYPIKLILDDGKSINQASWARSSEPLDMTPYLNLYPGQLPHPWWKWRITVEPKNLAGALYNIDNPFGSGGASVMAEDLVTMEGVLTSLPNPFSAPYPNWNFRGNLQLGITTDGGTTIDWCEPIWN